MRLPGQSEAACRVACGELGLGQGFMRLPAGRFGARDGAADEVEPRIASQPDARAIQQRVLAGTGRTHHQDQHPPPAFIASPITSEALFW